VPLALILIILSKSMFLVRPGEAIDRALLSHLLKMFTALGMYLESFEKPFLECTSEFYATEGVKYMQQSDISDYLKHVEVILDCFSVLRVVTCVKLVSYR
jgi:hypothetical protein